MTPDNPDDGENGGGGNEGGGDVYKRQTQARDAYPYYQHTAIGFNYRMSNVCAGIGRGQMAILNAHIAHHLSLIHI